MTTKDTIRTHVACQMLGLGKRQVQTMMERGVFRTAHKPGLGKNSHWVVSRSEVLMHLYKSHPNPDYTL